MLVRQEDFDNLSVYQKDLPVRRGCGFGPCACTGYCDLIIGWIDRDTYSSFMKSYVSYQKIICPTTQPLSESNMNMIRNARDKKKISGLYTCDTTETIKWKS